MKSIIYYIILSLVVMFVSILMVYEGQQSTHFIQYSDEDTPRFNIIYDSTYNLF